MGEPFCYVCLAHVKNEAPVVELNYFVHFAPQAAWLAGGHFPS